MSSADLQYIFENCRRTCVIDHKMCIGVAAKNIYNNVKIKTEE